MDAVPAEVDSALKWNEDKYMMEKEKEKGEKQPVLPGPARPGPHLVAQTAQCCW